MRYKGGENGEKNIIRNNMYCSYSVNDAVFGFCR